MKESKIHKISDTLFMFMPFILMALSLFKSNSFDLETFENGLSAFRTFDFGLSNFLIENLFNNSNNLYLLFMFDIMIYYLYWRLIDLVMCMFSFFIDFIKAIANKWRNY